MTINASHIGTTSEYIVIAEALKKGYNVLQPAGGFLSYDLVIDVRGRLVKVQVKTIGNRKDRRPECPTRRSINNKYRSGNEEYQEGDFDFAVCVHGQDVYIVPFAIFVSKSCFILGKKTEGFRNAWDLLEEFAPNAQRSEQPAFNPSF